MAGAYPDVPGRRMAWDADGTIMAYATDNDSPATTGGDPPWKHYTDATTAQKAELNDEDNFGAPGSLQFGASGQPGGVGGFMVAWIFPELREVDGYFDNGVNAATSYWLYASADTNNGIDGSWANAIGGKAQFSAVSTAVDEYRDSIQSAALTGRRALRVFARGASTGNGVHMRQTHIYGTISPGQTPDRLLFIDEATGLEFTASKDYGNVPRGGSEDFEWRIKNNSASLAANTIQYTAEALYLDASAWFTHTLPGGSTYQATRQVASLAAATTSSIVTTRRITPGTQALGPYAARLFLTVDSWT